MEHETAALSRITVSVVILAYNQEKEIRRTVESVLGQDCPFPIEILIGEDCSQDETPRLVRELAAEDPRIVPMIREKNLGSTANLYDLQRRAKGKYIAYLDGDDCWCDSGKLRRQVEFLESESGYIACTHRCLIVDENGRPREKQRLHWISDKEDYTIADFHGIVLPGHYSTLMHRNFFPDSGDRWRDLITAHPQIGDRSLCLLLASMGRIRQLPEVMSWYTVAERPRASATELLYRRNARRVEDDYELTRKLERIAAEQLQVDGGFEDHICELFVSALAQALRAPSREHGALVSRILRENDAGLCLRRAPGITLQKLKER